MLRAASLDKSLLTLTSLHFGTYCSVFNEALRHFPPVIGLPKYSAEDTVFTTTNAAGEQGRLPVPRGTFITVSATALHHNRMYPSSFQFRERAAR